MMHTCKLCQYAHVSLLLFSLPSDLGTRAYSVFLHLQGGNRLTLHTWCQLEHFLDTD